MCGSTLSHSMSSSCSPSEAATITLNGAISSSDTVGTSTGSTAWPSSSTAPAGRALRPPGLAGWPDAGFLAPRDVPDLGRVGLARQPEARAREEVDAQLARAVPGGLGAAARAVADRPAPDLGQVLDRHRHAQEGSLVAVSQAAVRVLRRRACRIVAPPDDGVQLSVEAVHLLEARVEQLGGRELPAPERVGELDDGLAGETGHGRPGRLHARSNHRRGSQFDPEPLGERAELAAGGVDGRAAATLATLPADQPRYDHVRLAPHHP